MLFTYRIAGIVLRVESDHELDYLRQSAFKYFRVDDIEPDAQRHLRALNPASLTLPPLTAAQIESFSLAFSCAPGSWQSPFFRSPVIRSRLEAHLNRHESVMIEARDLSFGIMDWARRHSEQFYLPDFSPALASWYPGPGILAPFLPAFGATLVHASGVVRDGRTALFAGPDNSGKTTVAGQPGAGLILSDDQIILRKQGDAFTAYGTPWGLNVDSTNSAPLGGLFLLEQAEEFELVRLKPRVLAQYLWSEPLHYHFPLPKPLRLRAFDLVLDACRQVPVYRMRFRKDFIDWGAVDAAMDEG